MMKNPMRKVEEEQEMNLGCRREPHHHYNKGRGGKSSRAGIKTEMLEELSQSSSVKRNQLMFSVRINQKMARPYEREKRKKKV